MKKKKVNVNKRKISRLSFLILLIFFLLLLLPYTTSATVDDIGPVDGIPLKEQEFERLKKVPKEVAEYLYGGFGESPSLTIVPEMSGPSPTPFPPGSIRYFRQCNYRSSPLGEGCSICNAGCGPTAVATIINMFGSTDDPPAVVAKYKSAGYYAGCDGTVMQDAKNIFEDQYGLTTSEYIFSTSTGYEIKDVADDIRKYVEDGWVLFVLTNFCSGGCGHYIAITDIDDDNNVTSYDPYYELTSTSQPISYPDRSPKFPLYRYAFGVKE